MYSLRNTQGPSRPCTQNVVSVAFALIAVGLCLAPSRAQAKYGGGAGTQNSPYLISTPEQMNEIGLSPGDWSRHFRLTADIDMSELGGSAYNIIGSATAGFSGVFDGNGHEISNLSLTTTHQLYTGLFGIVGGEVRNLGLAGPAIVAQGSRTRHRSLVPCQKRQRLG